MTAITTKLDATIFIQLSCTVSCWSRRCSLPAPICQHPPMVDQPANSLRTIRRIRETWPAHQCPCRGRAVRRRSDIPTPTPVRSLRSATDVAWPSEVWGCRQKSRVLLYIDRQKILILGWIYNIALYVPWTPSLLQLRIFPVIMSPMLGRNTMYLKWTSVCEAPSPGRMIESLSFVMSFNAMQRPTFRRT